MPLLPGPAVTSGHDHDARVARLVEQLGRDRRHDVAELHRQLFGDPLTQVLMRLGRPGVTVGSAVDRRVRLSVVVNMVEVDEADGGIAGTVVMASVVGHHRQLDRRVAVDSAEEEAWARLAFGPQWQAHAYRQLGRVTQVNDEVGAAFFLVFLGVDGQVTHPSEDKVQQRKLQPL